MGRLFKLPLVYDWDLSESKPSFNRLVLSSNLRRPIPNEQLSSSDLPQRIFFSLLETIDIDLIERVQWPTSFSLP